MDALTCFSLCSRSRQGSVRFLSRIPGASGISLPLSPSNGFHSYRMICPERERSVIIDMLPEDVSIESHEVAFPDCVKEGGTESVSCPKSLHKKELIRILVMDPFSLEHKALRRLESEIRVFRCAMAAKGVAVSIDYATPLNSANWQAFRSEVFAFSQSLFFPLQVGDLKLYDLILRLDDVDAERVSKSGVFYPWLHEAS